MFKNSIENKVFKLVVACLLIFIIFLITSKHDQGSTKTISQTKTDNSLCIWKTHIEDIQKTLLVAYPYVSKYEAKVYSITMDEYSEKYKIPWMLYCALLKIESSFNINAESPVGAKGLTQVMEGTGRHIAEKLEIDYKENRTLWNPILNMNIGFTYLSETFDSTQVCGRDSLGEYIVADSCLHHVIARYNGGPAYKKSISQQDNIKQYVKDVINEYRKLKLIYLGVLQEDKDKRDCGCGKR
jgi:soluble lytic murein transglycosylase-like protein